MDLGAADGGRGGGPEQPGKLIALAERQASSSLDCERCRVLADRFNRPLECVACVGGAALAPENYEVFALITKYGASFFDGFGGIQLPAIVAAMELEGVPAAERGPTAERILTYLAVYRKARRARDG